MSIVWNPHYSMNQGSVRVMGVCPHYSNKQCFKESRPMYITDENFNKNCKDNYTSCIFYTGQANTNRGCCYVATCVYGSYDCPEVWTLRRYRDTNLKQSLLGRQIIRAYYVVGPRIVELFGNKLWFHNLCKPILDRMVSRLQKNGVKSNPYYDT